MARSGPGGSWSTVGVEQLTGASRPRPRGSDGRRTGFGVAGVSPPRLMARSSSSAAAAGAPASARASSAAVSSASRVAGSALEAAERRDGGPAVSGCSDDIGQRAVHLPAAGGSDDAVDPAGQKRMGKPHAVSCDLHDAVGLGHLEELDDAFGALIGDLGEQVDRRRADAGGGQQHRLGVLAELVEPRTDQVGQRARQRGVGDARLAVNRPRQFERIERVAARELADPDDRRSGEGAAQPAGDHLAESAKAERPDLDALDAVEPVQLQPLGAVPAVGFGAFGDEHPDATLEPTGGERDDGLAGGVQPLHVVDGHDHRRVGREPVDQRQEGRRDHAFVGGRSGAVAFAAAPCRSRRAAGGAGCRGPPASTLQEVGEHGEGQAGSACPARADSTRKPRSRACSSGPQPQRGLADARFALDDERGRMRRGGLEERRHRARFQPSGSTPEPTLCPSRDVATPRDEFPMSTLGKLM